jgi:hypothetical protein
MLEDYYIYILIIILFSVCCILIRRLRQNEIYRMNNIILQNHLFEMQNKIDMLEVLVNKYYSK